MRELKLFLLLGIVLTISNIAHATTFYWVGGTGKWSDFKTHWATTSGGTVFQKQVPTSLDDVIFDANSFSTTGQIVTIDSVAYCKSMDWTGAKASSKFQIFQDINIYGSLTFSSTMVLEGTKAINFASSASNNKINSGGLTIPGAVNFNGAGSWYLTNILTLASKYYNIVNISNGTLFTKGYSILTFGFKTDGTATRKLVLSNSWIRTRYFSDSQSTGLTINPDTSDIELSQDNSYIYSTGNISLNRVRFTNNNGSQATVLGTGKITFKRLYFFGNGFIYGAHEFDTLVFSPNKDYKLEYGKIQTINKLFAGSGTCGGFIYLTSTKPGTQAIINSGLSTINLAYMRIRDIKATGATYTVTSSTDLGNNTGLTITGQIPKNLYWINNSGSWTDGNHWSLTSGGTASGCIPNDSDNVFFDASSFNTGTRTVTVADEAHCRDIDFTGVKFTPTFKLDTFIYINGSATFSKFITFQAGYFDTVFFVSNRYNTTIASKSMSIPVPVTFDGKGQWKLMDSLSIRYAANWYTSIRHKSGTINTNNQTINCYVYYLGQNKTNTGLICGNSLIKFKYFADNGLGTYTLDAGKSTFEFQWVNSYLYTYRNLTFNYVTFSDKFGTTPYIWSYTGKLTIKKLTFEGHGYIYYNNTIDSLILRKGKTLYLYSGSTQTVKYLEAIGDCSNSITIQATSATYKSTIAKAGGNLTFNFCRIKDIACTGSPTYTANNSIDLGNNSGIIFSGFIGTDFYWIKGTGNWNDTSHWSLTSGGTPAGCVPTDSDNVYFDSNSFVTNTYRTVTLNLSAGCRTMDWTGAKFKPIFNFNTNNLSVSGSMILIKNMSLTSYGDVAFLSNKGGNVVNTAGNSLRGNVTFAGAGSWTLLDSLDVNYGFYSGWSSALYLSQGSLSFNGQKVKANFIIANTTKNFALSCGAADVLVNYFYIWNSGTFAFNGGTSYFHNEQTNSYISTGKTLKFYNYTFANPLANSAYIYVYYGQNLSFNKLKLLPSVNFYGTQSFDTLKLSSGKAYNLQNSYTYSIRSLLDVAGNCNFVSILNYGNSVQATLYKASAPITVSFVKLQGIRGLGPSSFTANSSYDLGNNSGWTINGTTPRKFYWIGDKGDWFDGNLWSFSSGGAPAGCIPNDSDDVFFDSLSFTKTKDTVFTDSLYAFRNMSWVGARFKPVFKFQKPLECNGSMTLIKDMVWAGDKEVNFKGKGFHTITSAGQTFINDIKFTGGGGEYKLLDSLTLKYKSTVFLRQHAGTLNFNGFNVRAYSIRLENAKTKILNLSNSTLNIHDLADSSTGTTTINRGTSSINLIDNGSYIYSVNTFSLWNVYFTKKSSTGCYINSASTGTFNKLQCFSGLTIWNSNTYDSILFNPGSTYNLGEAQTQTLNGYQYFNGSPSGLTLIQSTNPGKKGILKKISGSVCTEFVYVKDNQATGGASFTAGNASINLGNNTGWTFNNSYSCLPRSINTLTVSGNNYCPGDIVKVPYTKSGNFNPTNHFIAQLSDDKGNFSSPDSIGALQTNLSDTIIAKLPYGLKSGTKYRFRVISDAPHIIGTDNGTDKTILQGPNANAGKDTGICIGMTAIIGKTALSGSSYAWTSLPAGYTSTKAMDTVSLTSTKTYILKETLTSNSCSRFDSIVVSVNPLPTVLAGTNRSICAGTSTKIGDTAVSGMTYSWTSKPTGFTSSISNPTASPSLNTTYYLKVKNTATGCENTDSVKVTVLTQPIAKAGIDTTMCFGGAFTRGATAIGGYTYKWIERSTGNIFSTSKLTKIPSLTGYYVYTISVGTCSSTDSFKATINPLPAVNAGSDKTICAKDSTIIGTASVSGYTYSWTSIPSGYTSTKAQTTIAPTTTTTYILKQTNSTTTCSKSDTVVITVNSLPSLTIASNATICKGDSISIGGTSVSGNTYSWTSKPIGYSSTSSNPRVAPIITTTYYLTQTITATTCKAKDSVKITVTGKPTVSLGADKSICINDSTNIGVAPSSGYTFSWTSTPSKSYPTTSTINVKPSVTTIYYLTQTSTTTSCFNSDTIKVTVNPLPTPIVGSPIAICPKDSVFIGSIAVSGMSYSWTSNPSGFTSTLAHPKVSPSITTTYKLKITNTTTTCQNTDSVKITVRIPPTANAGSNKTICFGQSTGIGTSAVSGVTYSWIERTTGKTFSGATQTVSPISSGWFVLTASDAFCSAKDSVFVTVNPLPTANAGLDVPICLNGSTKIGMTAISGVTYSWTSNPSGFTSSSANPTVSPIVTTTYFLKAVNNTTTCQNFDTVIVSVNPLPQANTANDTTICFGNAVNLLIGTSVSGNTYSWTSKPSGFTSTLANPSVKPSLTTIYYLTETITLTGCSKTDSIKITVNPLPTPNAGADKTICFKDSTTLSTTNVSGHTYQWNILSSSIIATTPSVKVSPATTTSYTILETITSTGCQNSDTIKVNVNPLPTPNAGADAVLCFGDSIKIGKSPVIGNVYSWTSISAGFTSSQSNPTVKPTITRTYIVKETISLTSCFATDTMKITVNPLPIPKVSANKTVCYGTTISLGGSPTAGHTYKWTSKLGTFTSTLSNPSITATASDVYYLTEKITSTGCIAIDSVIVTVNPLPITNAGLDQHICLTQSAQIGTKKISGVIYSWTSSPSGFTSTKANPIAIPSVNTTYYLQTTDSITGCKDFDTVGVFIHTVIAVNTGNNKAICIGDSVLIGLPPIAGNAYAWNSNPTGFNSTSANPIVKPILTTSYTLQQTVTATGCVRSDTVVVKVNLLPIVTVGNDTAICIKDSINIGGSSVSGMSYTWTSAPTGFTASLSKVKISPAFTTEYYLLVKNISTGCINNDSVNVIVRSRPAVKIIGDTFVCQLMSYPYQATVKGQSNIWKYNSTIISNGKIDSISMLYTNAGKQSISLRQTNTFGCADSQTISISVNPKPTIALFGDTVACLKDTKPYNATGISKTGSYTWTHSGSSIAKFNLFDSMSLAWTSTGLNNISIIGFTNAGCSDTTQLNVRVNPLPTPIITGDTILCNLTSDIYTPNTTSGSTYNWKVSGGYSTKNVSKDSLFVNWNTSGSWSIVLLEKNKYGCNDSTIKTIKINPLPSVTLKASKYTICVGEKIWLSVNNISGSTYKWNTSSIPYTPTTNNDSIQINWSVAGLKTIWVKTTLSTGCSDSQSINITVDSLPTPAITANPSYCKNNTDILLANTKIGSNYLWIMTNASIIAGANNDTVQVKFNIAGTTTAKLIETNKFGCTDSVQKSITVFDLPKPAITGKTSACEKEPLSYLASRYNKSTVQWKSIGASVVGASNKDTFNISYSTSGLYSIKLIETDSNTCFDSVSTSVTINPLPIISLKGDTSICQNLTAHYFFNGGATSTFNWKLQNGNILSGSGSDSISVAFTSIGLFNIKAIETTSKGCTDSANMTVNVHPVPIVTITGKDTLCATSIWTYLAPKSALNTYQWAADSGVILSSATADSIGIKWNKAISGNVKLKITNQFACQNQLIKPIIINPLPIVSISGAKEICAYAPSEYISTTSNPSKIWKSASSISNTSSKGDTLTISYKSAGTDVIKLIETNAFGCSDSNTFALSIRALPDATFVGDTIICEQLTKSYQPNTSKTTSTYAWTLLTNTIVNPTFVNTFNKRGLYTIKLLVKDSFGCQDSTTQSILIQPKPIISLSGSDTACNGAKTTYNITGDSAKSNYIWKFNNGIGLSSPSNTNQITWNVVGNDTISVIFTNIFGCSDTASQTVSIRPKPRATFTAKNSCITDIVLFNPSFTDYQVQNWNFGDGNTSTQLTPSHQFAMAQSYIAYHLVENNFGCKDSYSLPITIYPTPTADFSTDSFCINLDKNILNLSNGNIKNTWYLNVTFMSNAISPKIRSSIPRTYDIDLQVTNTYGCKDSIHKQIVIKALPDARFSNYKQEPANVISLFANINPQNNISVFAWEINDSVYNSDYELHTQLPKFGTYKVTRTLTTDEGCIAKYDSTIEITFDKSLGYKAFPNPFVERTTIQFTLQEPSHVIGVIYDMFGKELRKLFEGEYNVGIHTYEINADDFGLSQGTYVMRIKANNIILAEKIIRAR